MIELLRTTGSSIHNSGYDAGSGVSGAGVYFKAAGAPGAGFHLSSSLPFRMTTVTALVSILMSIARGHIEPCTVAANSIREAVEDLIVRAMGWSHSTVNDRAHVLPYCFGDSQQHSDLPTMAE